MKIRMLITTLVLAMLVSANVHAVVINFDNTEVPTISNLDVVTTQWNGYGLDIENAYWYVDNRDTFDGMGLSSYPFGSSVPARITFLGGVINNLSIDWWTIERHVFVLNVYDAANNLLDSFSSSGDMGTYNVIGSNIAYLEFGNSGGYTQVSTLRYNEAVPAPAILTLMLGGLLGLVMLRRKAI